MSILHIPLFTSDRPCQIGVGFHNVGATGSLRASNEGVAKEAEATYAGRCGHLPLHARTVGLLLEVPTLDICRQLAYLSYLFGKEIEPMRFATFRTAALAHQQDIPGQKALIIPYINVPEAETLIQETLGAETWGLPGKMVHLLKNKAEFYHLLDVFHSDAFQAPDYRIATIDALARVALCFLPEIEALYRQAGLAGRYPLGLVMRAAESEGNRSSCLVVEKAGHIRVIQHGEAKGAGHSASFSHWANALHSAQQGLVATMNTDKEDRVVISRYLDVEDSPGMSMVIMGGEGASLGWNSQLQRARRAGDTACIGTSAYHPQTAALRRVQEQYEERAATFFLDVLLNTAALCGIPFNALRGIANIDLMIPGAREHYLRQQRKQSPALYVAECNPRWTNYTDAIMTVLGASRRVATIQNMRSVIREGIVTLDKQPLPEQLDPASICERLVECDDEWQQRGLRIICRMAKNPMGLIYVGNVQQAWQEMDAIIQALLQCEARRRHVCLHHQLRCLSTSACS
ncbi:hypothetical protein [Ktedonobacter racemifer]|uniref:ATP-grasp domain-containing protein n=1 Tax=Ktedonobacter racemifer DSM 44963 TaxID=485913 RepID=D6TBZ7_KTERA|nr:hypothetical protein [Ktedonobacter racemifer]EFH88033.1 hypothetical protein Krac_9405 [Ktedonobacter racemifer DSM 44963]